MTLTLLIVLTVVLAGLLALGIEYCHNLRQEIDELWSLCCQFPQFMQEYDEKLRFIGTRLKALEGGDK